MDSPTTTLQPDATRADSRSASEAEAHAAASRIELRCGRLRDSAFQAGKYAAPILGVFTFLLLLFVNRQPDQGLVSHVFDSLGGAIMVALMGGATVWFGLVQMMAMYDKQIDQLVANGKLVPATRVGRPEIYGGMLARYTIGGALGHLWEPIAPALSERLPVFQVGYSYVVNGKTHRGLELFYGDEQVVDSDEQAGWVLVDPKSPFQRRWLVRKIGVLKDAPFSFSKGR